MLQGIPGGSFSSAIIEGSMCAGVGYGIQLALDMYDTKLSPLSRGRSKSQATLSMRAAE